MPVRVCGLNCSLKSSAKPSNTSIMMQDVVDWIHRTSRWRRTPMKRSRGPKLSMRVEVSIFGQAQTPCDEVMIPRVASA